MTIPNDSHEWFSFEDPDELRIWMFDVTFLLSSWTCIFGQGCKGVLDQDATEMMQGCCSYGAHFSDKKDIARVKKAAKTLTKEQWQFKGIGTKSGITRKEDGETLTALVDDACVFLNRPGFEGGPGCALHRAAIERDVPHLLLKPDVCWQLPLRQVDLMDENTGYLTSMITQWDRKHWGPAGEEFHWWCTDAPEAFVGAVPAYEGLREELRAMTSETVFAALIAYLERRRGMTMLPHPALRKKQDHADEG
ncbi:MAG TPA: hypothetical protein VNE42_10405 [Acidimicrobiales bacterium]|nr:hypothetical protein [Acidimicrobiales bacterium]